MPHCFPLWCPEVYWGVYFTLLLLFFPHWHVVCRTWNIAYMVAEECKPYMCMWAVTHLNYIHTLFIFSNKFFSTHLLISGWFEGGLLIISRCKWRQNNLTLFCFLTIFTGSLTLWPDLMVVDSRYIVLILNATSTSSHVLCPFVHRG